MDNNDSIDDIPAELRPNPKGQAYLRSLQRQSLDKIMVYNPLPDDFDLIYTESGMPEGTGYHYIIPNRNRDMGWGQGKRVLEYYLANLYFTRMKDLMINKLADEELEKIKQKLESRGVTDVSFNAHTELERTGKFRTNNKELSINIRKQIILGVVERFGMDTPQSTGSRAIKKDILSGDAMIMQDLPMYNEGVGMTVETPSESVKGKTTHKQAVAEIS